MVRCDVMVSGFLDIREKRWFIAPERQRAFGACLAAKTSKANVDWTSESSAFIHVQVAARSRTAALQSARTRIRECVRTHTGPGHAVSISLDSVSDLESVTFRG
jgi:hypothetical protein